MHVLTHRAAQVCLCGAELWEDLHGVVTCSASGERLTFHEERHSKSCIRDDDGFWACVKQCPVHRSQLKLVPDD